MNNDVAQQSNAQMMHNDGIKHSPVTNVMLTMTITMIGDGWV
jgi:hypothetical protein